MFGSNPVRKYESHADGNAVQLREVFYTLQGEGPFSGHPSVFVRLTGCNLRCFFCDTKWDDERDAVVSVDDVVRQVDAAAHGGKLRRRTDLVVITGGEPLRQDLSVLLLALRRAGYRMQIETAGTLWQECLGMYLRNRLTVVVSPKTGKLNAQLEKRADAFKYVVNAAGAYDPVDGLPAASTQRSDAVAMLAKPTEFTPVYLSPMDEYDDDKNEANRREVARRALEYGYIGGVQLHKLLSLE